MKYQLFNPPTLTGKYLPRVLKSRWLTTGPECERLKVDLSRMFHIAPERVVLGSSATALWQAVLDVLQPRLIALTKKTWPGIKHALPITFKGANTLDLITHLGGAASIDEDEKNIQNVAWTVLDACHSWLPMTPGYDASFTSFYPTKLVPGAEGGALFLHTDRIKTEDIEAAINCGQLPAHKRGTAALTDRFGRKGAMTDVQAALNREALELHDGYYQENVAFGWWKMRAEAEEQRVAFRNQPVRPYLFQVDCPPARIPTVRGRLAKQGIPTAWNFPPSGLITIPAHDALSERDCRKIMKTVKECLK